MSVAAVIITKDEEQNIGACLQSVEWADEIIVVDAQSRDRTVELAKPQLRECSCGHGPGMAPKRTSVSIRRGRNGFSSWMRMSACRRGCVTRSPACCARARS